MSREYLLWVWGLWQQPWLLYREATPWSPCQAVLIVRLWESRCLQPADIEAPGPVLGWNGQRERMVWSWKRPMKVFPPPHLYPCETCKIRKGGNVRMKQCGVSENCTNNLRDFPQELQNNLWSLQERVNSNICVPLITWVLRWYGWCCNQSLCNPCVICW